MMDELEFIESAQDAKDQLRELIREAHETMQDLNEAAKDSRAAHKTLMDWWNQRIADLKDQLPEFIDDLVIAALDEAVERVKQMCDSIEDAARDRARYVVEKLENPSVHGVSAQEMVFGGQLVAFMADDEELSKTFKKLMRERLLREADEDKAVQEKKIPDSLDPRGIMPFNYDTP